MKLTSSGEVQYSEAEKKLFGLLSTRERRSTSELVQLKYDGETVPFHAKGIIRAIANSLTAKVERNGEPFTIMKSARRGPYPVEFWIETKGEKSQRRAKK